MNQQAMHQCPTCGFQWIHGHDGNHSCSFVLRQTVTELRAQIADHEEAAASVRKLVRELDVAWNGEAGAAKQASLCDMVAQIMNELPRLHEKATNRNDELELLRKLENCVRSIRGSHPSIKEGIVLDALDALREKQARA